MSQELYWLVLVTLVTAVISLPYILNRIIELGLLGAVNGNVNIDPQAAWAKRLMRAHANAVENLVVFAVLVIITVVNGSTSELTLLLCKVYFFARVVHAIVYAFGLSWLRTLAFLIGFVCQVVLGFLLIL